MGWAQTDGDGDPEAGECVRGRVDKGFEHCVEALGGLKKGEIVHRVLDFFISRSSRDVMYDIDGSFGWFGGQWL